MEFMLVMLHVNVCCDVVLFLAALWSPAGKALISWLLCVLCFLVLFHFPNVFWSTSELRARLALLNWFKPSSKIFY